MPKGTGRKPDYILSGLLKGTNIANRNLGAAWINDDGSIYLMINPFVVLQSSTDHVLTLFKREEKAHD